MLNSLVVFVMAIDVGPLSLKLSDYYKNKILVSKNLTNEFIASHSTFVANAFFDEIGNKVKVVYEVCGDDYKLKPKTLIDCLAKAKEKQINYVIIPYNGDKNKNIEEFYSLSNFVEYGGKIFFSAGNKPEASPHINYPHSWCFSLVNCFVVSKPDLIFSKTVVEKDSSCLGNYCLKGSSFSVARYAAKTIRKELGL